MATISIYDFNTSISLVFCGRDFLVIDFLCHVINQFEIVTSLLNIITLIPPRTSAFLNILLVNFIAWCFFTRKKIIIYWKILQFLWLFRKKMCWNFRNIFHFSNIPNYQKWNIYKNAFFVIFIVLPNNSHSLIIYLS